MKKTIKNRLLAGNEVVMNISTNSSKLKGWLAIYPIKVADLALSSSLKNEYDQLMLLITKEKWSFRILSFEIPSEYIEHGWDVSEEEMINHKSSIVFGYDSLINKLNSSNFDSNLLIEPWKSDYPL